MAIYRFEAKIVSRSAGRSATAAAAYRSAARLTDERTGLAFNYSRKRGVLHTEILAPADAPHWMGDRSRLWNAVEVAEKRRDAQIARDLVLALPHELTHEQRVTLVREFASEAFVARGMIADIAIHAPDHRGDDRNHHAHVLLTMRCLMGQGFGPKVRDWNATSQLEEWRAGWAMAVNLHLARAGCRTRVDHRSLADRGVNREPEPKQGPVATAMEREGWVSHAGEDRRAAKDRNQQRQALASELQQIILELEAESDTASFEGPQKAARKISRGAWCRYLYELWQTVARGITKPIARLVKRAGREFGRRSVGNRGLE